MGELRSKVIHLVPYDGIGGVEAASRSMVAGEHEDIEHEGIEFEVQYIWGATGAARPGASMYNPWSYLSAAWRIRRANPDLLVVSLWRCSIVGLIVKLLNPRIRLVTFLHLDKDAHALDRFFTYASLSLSTEIWADSAATLHGRLRGRQRRPCRVISFVTERFEALPQPLLKPAFIFWGRITGQKGLDRALHLFAEIRGLRPDASFCIVGPDGGALQAIMQLCSRLGLSDCVTFQGVATREQIAQFAAQASFYLQTSVAEGMAMSVVESMQLGLVPVVTPVGEVAAYCQQGFNAVLVDSDRDPVAELMALLDSPDRYLQMSANARATWEGSPLYRDSVLAACRDLLGGGAPAPETAG